MPVQGFCLRKKDGRGPDHFGAGKILHGVDGAVADVVHGGEKGCGVIAMCGGHRQLNLGAEVVNAPGRFKQAQGAAGGG